MDRDDREFDKHDNGNFENDGNRQRQTSSGFVPWSMQQQNGQNQQRRYEYTGTGQGFNMAPQPVRRNSGLKTGLIIILVIVGVMFVAGIGCNALISEFFQKGITRTCGMSSGRTTLEF